MTARLFIEPLVHVVVVSVFGVQSDEMWQLTMISRTGSELTR